MTIFQITKIKENHRLYSTTVNPFEDFKPEILISLKESYIKIFVNPTNSSHQKILEFILSSLTEIIKSHNGNKLSIKLHILQGKNSKLILSETDKTYIKEDIDYLNKILSRRNYSPKEGTKSRNRDSLTLMYDLRGMAATVKRLCSAIQKNNISPDSYSVLYTAAFDHLLRKGNTLSFQFINVNTSIIKSSYKIGPRESHKYFFGFSDDEILEKTPKLKSTSRKTNSTSTLTHTDTTTINS